MRLVRVFIPAFVFLCLLIGVCLSATDTKEEFPEIGFVKNDGSNVRAGDNINFETLCRLKLGEPVKIIGKRYSWFKILLPKKAHLYIKNDYVDLTKEKGVGILNALRVNLRAGPGTKYSILGQASKPDELNVISDLDGWYEIEPPEGIGGWIHSNQIVFSLAEIEKLEVKKKVAAETEEDEPAEKPEAVTQVKENAGLKLTFEPLQPKGNLVFSTQNNQ